MLAVDLKLERRRPGMICFLRLCLAIGPGINLKKNRHGNCKNAPNVGVRSGWTNLRCRLQVLIYQHISARTKQHGDSTHLVVGGALHLLFIESVRWPAAQGICRQVNVVIGSPLAKLEQDVLYSELSF